MDYIIVKREKKYVEYPILKNLVLGHVRFGKSGKTLVRKVESEMQMVSPYVWQKDEINGDYLFLTEEKQAFQRNAVVTIANKGADLCIKDFPYSIILEQDRILLTADSQESRRECPIYLNGKLLQYYSSVINDGDTLLLGTCKITVFSDRMVVNALKNLYSCSLLELSAESKAFEEFPRYKRSPRMIKRPDSSAVEIQQVPSKVSMGKRDIIQIIVTPLATMSVTIALSIIMKRGMYVLISVATTVMSLIFSAVKFSGDRKECVEKEAARQKAYEQYLLKKRKEIFQAYQKEKEAYEYNYPSVYKLENMIRHYSSRIYERNYHDGDFLTVSIGYETAPVSFTINSSYDELALEKDELELEAWGIKEEFSTIEKKPVVIDLKQAHLGLVGEKDNIHEQLKLLISQLTFFHSYHDLEIIAIYDSKYDEDFRWMRWYPHFRIKAINALGIINSEQMRDQVLGSLHQMIKERKQRLEETKKEGLFAPHFLFIIDEPKLVMDHSIMEYLGRSGRELGFSIIYTSHLQANLPENMGTVVLFENSENGRLLLAERQTINKKFTLSHVEAVDLEVMARNLGVLIHEQGVVSQIPQSITFFELYQVDRPEELQVEARWRNNESHKTLAVPLGVRAVDDYVYLNLHEKAHGPHGLVAGTTGSGKSEIVQSYILSLAVNFHPYEVGFLLIDYKGGGMAGLFKNLPHLLGTITNLDGSESMRAMASIKSELTRRQRIFSENDVNHINAYNKLFKMGKVTEPIPHLFLISDEFAELKKEQPEFMSELVSAARIGRSLGIHLILATQKPSGVVDDQIWTNSKFKLALKVQNESDSKEILKTPDAANITQPGRAYLQVGNNEIYELFQSAWSGASYVDETEEETVDNRVYVVNALGQGELVNQDLSEGEEKEQIRATQLDVVVDHINEIFQKQKADPVKRPWLPSLPKQLTSPYIHADQIGDLNTIEELDLNIPLGLVDIPEKQMQQDYVVNLIEDGNLAIFGASGFGKSIAMTTVMLSLAVKNSPKNLNYYILDFGNSALIQLKNLPHTADYLSMDDEEKLSKLIKLMTEQIQKRKRMFAQVSAMNFDMYNRMADEKLPAIILFIDNYDVVKEMNYEIEAFINQVARDGMGIGIYLMIGASRQNAVKLSIFNSIKNKLTLYMFDKSDMNNIVGRTQYPLNEIKGRGLVKLEEVNQIQIYCAVTFATMIDYMDSIRQLIGTMSNQYSGKKVKGIPVLPESLDQELFREYLEEEQELYRVPVGLDAEQVELLYMNLLHQRQIIIGGSQAGKTNLFRLLLTFAHPGAEFYVVDDKSSGLMEYQEREKMHYYQDELQIPDLLRELEELTENRQQQFEAEKQNQSGLLPKMYYQQLPPVVLLIEDWDNFTEWMKAAKNPNAEKIIIGLASVSIGVIVTTPSSKMKGFDNLTKYMKDTPYGIVLGAPNDQNLFRLPVIKQAKKDASMGIVYENGVLTGIKIPLISK